MRTDITGARIPLEEDRVPMARSNGPELPHGEHLASTVAGPVLVTTLQAKTRSAQDHPGRRSLVLSIHDRRPVAAPALRKINVKARTAAWQSSNWERRSP